MSVLLAALGLLFLGFTVTLVVRANRRKSRLAQARATSAAPGDPDAGLSDQEIVEKYPQDFQSLRGYFIRFAVIFTASVGLVGSMLEFATQGNGYPWVISVFLVGSISSGFLYAKMRSLNK